MRGLMGLALAALLLGGAARAEVTDKSAAGFEVTEKATIAAPVAQVYAALLKPGAWWSKDHTWGHDAKALSMDLAAGCFCEKLPHGFVRHLTIIYADGGSELRLSGGLGPMQFTGASGALAYVLKDNAGQTELTATYDVGGYAKGGLADRFAAPLDHVLGEQVARLKKYIETGKPD